MSVLGAESTDVSLSTEVPQGSVLGSILFSLYVGPLYEITLRYGIRARFYAYDTQLYNTIDPDLDTSQSMKSDD